MQKQNETRARLQRAKALLWECPEFRALPSRYWSVANRLLDLVDLDQPLDWVTVPVDTVARELGKTRHHITDALSWLEEYSYAICRSGKGKTQVQVRLLASFTRPLELTSP